MIPDPFDQIAAVVAAPPSAAPREPRPAAAAAGDAEPERFPDDFDDGAGESAPLDIDPAGVDPAALAACSRLDHSDTDNGTRLLAHFGADIRVLRQAEARAPAFVTWTGLHWDSDNGALGSHAIAQKVGGRIQLEADLLAQTPSEARAIAEAEAIRPERAALEKSRGDWTDEARARVQALDRMIAAADAARADLRKRRVARRKFGISSKNAARIGSMLACAAPHCAVDPDDFNADPYVLATRTHTLRFSRQADPECPDPDVERLMAVVEAREGHAREDMLTRYVPVAYEPDAACPRWLAFLERFLPAPPVRDFVQTFSGLGLLGRTVQMLVFHYGNGANGKSVFMETLMRVLGPLAVGLPAESITGQGERASGGASPDLARLYGARTVRVLELPPDKPLHEDLIKKLTGGEKIPVRTLFKGYFDFTPVFTCHMSGNGFPRIDGTDNGIWRRMAVVHWPVTLAEGEQREFEDVLAEFRPEYPGILNWLIEGAKAFIERGVVRPDEVRSATADYRSEMDPIADFLADCVEPAPAESVTARDMFNAYKAWSLANARFAVREAKFGRVMKTRIRRADERIRRYLDVRLHDVPEVAEPPREPPEDYR